MSRHTVVVAVNSASSDGVFIPAERVPADLPQEVAVTLAARRLGNVCDVADDAAQGGLERDALLKELSVPVDLLLLCGGSGLDGG